MARRILGFPATVFLLGVVSLLADVSGELLFAVLPFFVASTGGGALAVGLAGGVGDAVSQLGKVASGYLSDSLGRRKPFVAAGYGMSAASKVLLAFATWWPVAVALRGVERVGKGVRSAPRDALLAESVAEEERGRAFGLHRAMDSLGSVAGVALALLLVGVGLAYDHIVLLSGFLGVLALIPFLWVREEPRQRVSSGLRLRARGLTPAFRRYMLVAALFGLGNVTVLLLMLRASPFFPEGWQVLGPILLYMLSNAASTLVAIPAGHWSDRAGRRPVVAVGFALFALSLAGFAFADTLTPVAALFLLAGVSYGIVDAGERAYAVDLAGDAERGTALGVYATVTGLAALAGGLIAGFLWQAVGPSLAFGVAAGLAGAAVGLLLGFVKDPV